MIKKVRQICCFVFLSLSIQWAYAQTPYFQQEVNITMNVYLDDVNHSLTGDERISYINHSPDTLHEIYFHLWPNAYKNNSTALCRQMMHDGNLSLYKAKAVERGYIHQLAFTVNGQPVHCVTDSTYIDICKLILASPLIPGDSVIIATPFVVKIPDAKFSRLGHVGQSYMITQWYPKPAVYDSKGWHPLPYLNQGEFYSEYGNFDVTINVPDNYVVAATGNLQTETEKQFIENKISANQSSTAHSSNDFPVSSLLRKCIRFTLADVHDFAWFADKRFQVARKQVTLPHSGKKVDCYAYYTNSQPELWMKAVDNIADAVYSYSKWVGDYPYETCTAIDGTISAGGGMEYPTITIIGKVQSGEMLDNVIAHEVGHNWFYGVLGSNERDHPWMDEGMNSYYESRYMKMKYSSDKNYLATYLGIKPGITQVLGFNDFNAGSLSKLEYLITARQNNDQPLNLTSENFSALNYGTGVYSKTSLILQYLCAYLGESLFDSTMQRYFSIWKFKHPQPEDFQQVFKEFVPGDLNWFFNDMLCTTKKLDYKIISVKKKEDALMVKIKNNRNQIAAPFSISSVHADSVSALVWHQGFTGIKTFAIKNAYASKVIVNEGNNFLDIAEANNAGATNGMLKTGRPFHLSFFTRYENPERTQVFYLPVAGYNAYDGMMAGMALHSISFVKKKFEYAVVPMYGFKSGTFTFTSHVNYALQFPESSIDKMDFTASPRHFSYDTFNRNEHQNYYTIPFAIKARLKKSIADPGVENNLTAKIICNSVEIFDGETYELYYRNRVYLQAMFTHENFSKLDPGAFVATVEQGEKYVKAYMEAKKSLTAGKTKQAWDLRCFAGTFLINKRNDGLANFQSGAWRGDKDYLLEEIYFGRSERSGVLSQQMVNRDGGLKIYYPVSTHNWMAGINLSYKLPLSLLKLFADGVFYGKPQNSFEKKTSFRYDAGICAVIAKDILEIYFPLICSSEIKEFYELNNLNFSDKIRFVLNIKKLNPAKLRDSVSR